MDNTTVPSWLECTRWALLAACGVLLLLIGLEHGRTAQRMQTDIDLVNDITKIRARLDHQLVQSQHYLANAPRDYDAYYRDVRLYYPLLLADRMLVDDAVGRLGADSLRNRRGWSPAWNQQRMLAEDMRFLHEAWSDFQTNVQERLGEKLAEPRLEWGAETLATRVPDLISAAEAVSRSHLALMSAERRLFGVAIWLLFATVCAVAALTTWRYVVYLRPLQRRMGDVVSETGSDIGLTDAARQLLDRYRQQQKVVDVLPRLIDEQDPHAWLTHWLDLQPPDQLWLWVALVELQQAEHALHRVVAHAGALSGAMSKTKLVQLNLDAQPHGHWHALSQDDANPSWSRLQALGADQLFALQGGKGRLSLVLVTDSSAGGIARPMTLLETYLVQYLDQQAARDENEATLSVQSVLHELRNPLTGVRLASEGLIDGSPEQAPRWQAMMQRDLGRVQRLLDDLRDQGARLGLSQGAKDIAQWLHQYLVRRLEQEQAPSLDIRGLCSATVLIDSGRIAQVLDNLLRNAAQAADEDGPAVEVSADQHDGYAVISICNAGGPLPANVRDNLFEPFTSSKDDGTGLGLLISKRLIDAHGGRLTIHDLAERPGWVEAVVELPCMPG